MHFISGTRDGLSQIFKASSFKEKSFCTTKRPIERVLKGIEAGNELIQNAKEGRFIEVGASQRRLKRPRC